MSRYTYDNARGPAYHRNQERKALAKAEKLALTKQLTDEQKVATCSHCGGEAHANSVVLERSLVRGDLHYYCEACDRHIYREIGRSEDQAVDWWLYP